MSDTGPDKAQGWNLPQPPAPATGPGSFGGPVPFGATAGPQGTGAHALPAAAPDAAAPDPDAPDAAAGAARRRKLLIFGGIAGAVVVIAIIVAVVASQGGKDEVALPTPTTSTILLPVPTPTLAPVARTATTAFASALPKTVLQYALASSAPEAPWVTAGAVEAYSETYSDGAAGKVVVVAGQWETAAAAAAAAKQLVAAIPAAATTPGATTSPTTTAGASAPTAATPSTLPESGNVTAAGQTVGTYSILDAGDGTGIAVWTNGASVFRATAPVADIHNVYAAYPL